MTRVITHLSLILDRSGSMRTIDVTFLQGAVELVDGLSDSDELRITLFATEAHVGGIQSVESARATLNALVPPNGSTRLYDTIAEVMSLEEDDSKKYIYAIVTDGLDNASMVHTRASVQSIIQATKEKGATVLFVGANMDAPAVAQSLGISTSDALTFAPSQEGAYKAMRSLSAAVQRTVSMEPSGFLPSERAESLA